MHRQLHRQWSPMTGLIGKGGESLQLLTIDIQCKA
jgi:hypothetical protein